MPALAIELIMPIKLCICPIRAKPVGPMYAATIFTLIKPAIIRMIVDMAERIDVLTKFIDYFNYSLRVFDALYTAYREA